jgi:hypothetical protein
MFKTLGAAVGAAVVILLLATVASKLTTHTPAPGQVAALHR